MLFSSPKAEDKIPLTYAIASSPHGHVLLAATERGTCFLALGDSEDDVIMALARSEFFFKAAFVRNDNLLRPWVEQVCDYLAGKTTTIAIPLNLLYGTDFQRQVWDALKTIPYGETRSYGEVATSLGNPKGARAVAHACAANQVALVIPCHRVIQSDGSPGGYGGGVERKLALLAMERQHKGDHTRSPE